MTTPDHQKKAQERWRSKIKRIEIVLPPELTERFDAVAESLGKSRAGLIKHWLEYVPVEPDIPVHDLRSRLESAEQEAFHWRQEANTAFRRIRELHEQVDHYQAEAIKVAEKNGQLIAELAETRRQIQALTSQRKAAPRGKK